MSQPSDLAAAVNVPASSDGARLTNEVSQDTATACCRGMVPKASPLALRKLYPSTRAVGLQVMGEVRVCPAVRVTILNVLPGGY